LEREIRMIVKLMIFDFNLNKHRTNVRNLKLPFNSNYIIIETREIKISEYQIKADRYLIINNFTIFKPVNSNQI